MTSGSNPSSVVLAALTLAACSTGGPVESQTGPLELTPGDSRTIDLRYLRFDVNGFEEVDTLAQLQAMPRGVLQDVWLFDLDARPLVVNSLEALRVLSSADVAALTPATVNMRKLLLMTPDNAELEGTNLEKLIGLSSAIGIPPAKVLADLLGRRVTDPLIPTEVVADVISSNVIATHPNVQTRTGSVDDRHPDGRWPVALGYIPLTLADVVTNFADLATRFGPVGAHPGFVLGAQGVSVVEDQFAMVSKVSANALPFKGVDLSSGTIASVNSIPSQIETVRDFSDPDWLTVVGLVPEPSIGRLSFGVVENDGFVPGGTSKQPAPTGDSPGWALPPWQFERLILDMARASVAGTPAHCTSYQLGTGAQAFKACIDDTGWVELTSFDNAGDPPAPAYIWDLELELAEVRLHDGGLSEGEGDVAFTVEDVGIGVRSEEIVEQVRQNLRLNPAVLEQLTARLSDSSAGAPDLYYVRGIDSLPVEQRGNWLFFVSEDDIALRAAGSPVRAYPYARPGFFRDPELRDKASSTALVERDTNHEKIQIETGDELYAGDDAGRVFRLTVLDNPSRSHIALEISRLQ